MNTKIDEEIWADARFEELDAEAKLAFFWIKTNHRRDLCGFCEVTKRRFEFEAGIPYEALARACEGLGDSLQEIEEGLYFVKNWVRRNIGSGPTWFRGNIAKSMVRELFKKTPAQQEIFLNVYPEVTDLLRDFSEQNNSKDSKKQPSSPSSPKSLASPSQGLAKDKAKAKEKATATAKEKAKSQSKEESESERQHFQKTNATLFGLLNALRPDSWHGPIFGSQELHEFENARPHLLSLLNDDPDFWPAATAYCQSPIGKTWRKRETLLAKWTNFESEVREHHQNRPTQGTTTAAGRTGETLGADYLATLEDTEDTHQNQ